MDDSPRSPLGSEPSGDGDSPSRTPSRPPGSRPASALVANIVLTIKRVDGKAKPSFTFKCHKKLTIANVKDRVNEEWGLKAHEQAIIFRGRRVNGDDRAMPLNTPDLAEVVKEAGEAGLQMAVMYVPKKLPPFLEQEGLKDINRRRKTEATVLHRAARLSALDVMEEILENNEFVLTDSTDNAGQTALHTAVSTWNLPACQILLKHHKFTKSNVRDNEGRTALHIAASWGDALVVRLILEHANFEIDDVNAKDDLGQTALEYAVDCGHEEAAKFIRRAMEGQPLTTPPQSRAGSRSPSRLGSRSPSRLGSRSPSRMGSRSPSRLGSRAGSKMENEAQPSSPSPSRAGSKVKAEGRSRAENRLVPPRA